MGFFARRALPGVEEVTADGRYRRALTLPHGPAVIALAPEPTHVDAVIDVGDPADLDLAVKRCRRLFDLDADAATVDARLAGSPLLAPLVRRTPGRRSPGAVDGAEMLVRAVVGQQVSLAASITVIGRAIERLHAETASTDATAPVTGAGGESPLRPFPAADAWASLAPDDLPMPRGRAEALISALGLVADGSVDLDDPPDPERVKADLLAVKGIGPWTVAYVAMRALGDDDQFLATDLALRRGLAAAGGPSTAGEALTIAERWRPYRSYALHHLWSMA